MRKFLVSAVGAAVFAGAFAFAPVSASALPVTSGAAQKALAANPMLEQVQVRRGAGRVVGARPVGVRPIGRPGGVAVRGGYRGGYRGGNGAAGAAAALGVLGVAAAIAASQQPRYYEPAPVYAEPYCHFERQPLYDRYGNYRGSRNVRVCD